MVFSLCIHIIFPLYGNGNPLQYSSMENPHGQRSLAGYSPWGRKESDTTELESPDGFQLSLDKAVGILADVEFDLVAAPESRGFIFGAALADRFRTAFVPIRKPGKLPRETISESYDLEYGTATLHMHTDAVKPGQRVVIVDDLLATGGTAKAAAKLVERLGGTVVKMIVPIELEGFKAREGILKGYDVDSLVKYPGK